MFVCLSVSCLFVCFLFVSFLCFFLVSFFLSFFPFFFFFFFLSSSERAMRACVRSLLFICLEVCVLFLLFVSCGSNQQQNI